MEKKRIHSNFTQPLVTSFILFPDSLFSESSERSILGFLHCALHTYLAGCVVVINHKLPKETNLDIDFALYIWMTKDKISPLISKKSREGTRKGLPSLEIASTPTPI